MTVGRTRVPMSARLQPARHLGKMAVLAVAALVVVIAAGCGGSDAKSYPTEAVAAIITSCNDSPGDGISDMDMATACACLAKKFQAKVPIEDFLSQASAVSKGSPWPEQWDRLLEECASELLASWG